MTGPGLRPHLRPRAGRGRAAIAGNGTGDTRWKVPGVLDWSTDDLQPACRRHQGHDDALRQRPRRLPVPGRRPQSDRGRTAAGRRSPISIFRGFYCWNSEVGAQDARDRQLLSRAVCHEPQSLGRRGFRGDHHPAFQIRRLALRPGGRAGAERASPNASPAPFVVRHQGGAGARSSPATTRTARASCASAASPRPRRARSSRLCSPKKAARPERVRFRAGHHGLRAHGAAPGCAARPRAQGEAPARAGRVSRGGSEEEELDESFVTVQGARERLSPARRGEPVRCRKSR